MKSIYLRYLNAKQKKEGVAILTLEKGNIKGRVIIREKEKRCVYRCFISINNRGKYSLSVYQWDLDW